MTINDMKYIENNEAYKLVKDLPLHQLCYIDGIDGYADYTVYLATEKRLCVFLACNKPDGTLHFNHDLSEDYEAVYSILKENVLDVTLPEAYEGIVSFTFCPYEGDLFPGTDEDNGFIEHTISDGNIADIIESLDISNEAAEAIFKKKLEAGYNKVVNKWLQLEPTYLIERSAEITAVKQIYSELLGISPEQQEYLSRFENLLEVVYNEWSGGGEVDGQNMMTDDDIAETIDYMIKRSTQKGELEQTMH